MARSPVRTTIQSESGIPFRLVYADTKAPRMNCRIICMIGMKSFTYIAVKGPFLSIRVLKTCKQGIYSSSLAVQYTGLCRMRLIL